MTPAEVLAAAADRLDALTSMVPAGPWGAEDRAVSALGGVSAWQRDVVSVGDDGEGGASTPRVSEYIAAMNPLVGKALAAMLRSFSAELARENRHFHDMWDEAARLRMMSDRMPGLPQALEIARLIMGAES